MFGFFKDLFFKKHDIKSNDIRSLHKTILIFKDFFKDKDLIKDNKLGIKVELIESNIVNYIMTCHEFLIYNNEILVNNKILNSNHEAYYLRYFIQDKGYILLNHMEYIDNHLSQLVSIIEYLNHVESKIIHRYIIHTVNIYRIIYNSYMEDDM